MGSHESTIVKPKGGLESIFPLNFERDDSENGLKEYFRDRPTWELAIFFKGKGLAALKEEDRRETWYEDWVAYQAGHKIYASVLIPRELSGEGVGFDLLRYARLLEVFAYFSPAHGYSLQTSFLGFFTILMGNNDALKREAAATLSEGRLLAFGVSEKGHGSDLLANEFTIASAGDKKYAANGTKYYIGNAGFSPLIAILGRETGGAESRPGRLPFLLMAARPDSRNGFGTASKIHTLGVRAGNVCSFAVKDYTFGEGDIIARGRDAWDAIFGTVTMGKFFLGFGSIGMCEHAWNEALTHIRSRILYGKPVLEMPHIEAAASEAYARLTAMKLYAYRTLDYVHQANEKDRRYLLYCAVQKAKVSTEGVKVMSLLSECIGAKGFETDTYFEMALRDVPLIPALEGSMHINLVQAAQFMARYFDRCDADMSEPASLVAGEAASRENPYLIKARSGALHSIAFGPFLAAYKPLAHLPAVATFARQATAFRRFLKGPGPRHVDLSDPQTGVSLGGILATIAYGQLVAENAARVALPAEMTSVIFSLLTGDLNVLALRLAALPRFDSVCRQSITRMVKIGVAGKEDWSLVARQCRGEP